MMLACGHERESFGNSICDHLRAPRKSRIDYFRWYTGCGLEMDLLCTSCMERRTKGELCSTTVVCQECFKDAVDANGHLSGVRGQPEIRSRNEPFNLQLRNVALPSGIGSVVDIVPMIQSDRSAWLLLTKEGAIIQFDTNSGEWLHRASIGLRDEPDHDQWCDHELKNRLYASSNGEFAAVVHDYGRYGQVIDLSSGKVTIELDGGDYHQETVPFSFAFAHVGGRIVAIHRTDWNRLDISDPATGQLLTQRNPTSYEQGQDRPPHYLDYFHGALHISPNAVHLANDGWVWHPAGVPMTWKVEPWLTDNVWESEDGPSLQSICCRDYWDRSMAWLDDDRIAIAGLGDEDEGIIDGARIFDFSRPPHSVVDQYGNTVDSCELNAFPGPAGLFLAIKGSLFSSDPTGLSRWDVGEGVRTGHLPGFSPTCYHKGTDELLQPLDGTLVLGKFCD